MHNLPDESGFTAGLDGGSVNAAADVARLSSNLAPFTNPAPNGSPLLDTCGVDRVVCPRLLRLSRRGTTSRKATQIKWARLSFALSLLPLLVFAPAFGQGMLLHGHDDHDDNVHLHPLPTGFTVRSQNELIDWHDAQHPGVASEASVAEPVGSQLDATYTDGIVLTLSHPTQILVRGFVPIWKPALTSLPWAAVCESTSPAASSRVFDADHFTSAFQLRSHVVVILQSSHSILR